MNRILNSVIGIIKRYNSFLITSHVRLDGDALGSELALYHTLVNMGKEAVVYNQDETPEIYRFLPGSETIVHTLPALEYFDVAIVLDCSDLIRIGNGAHLVGRMERIINIDHHISNEKFGNLSLVDHCASSSAELVYRLIIKMNSDITKETAINLYAAILTDTGGFCYRNTGKDTLIAAGNLVEKGADPQWISENIYESNSPVKIKLLTLALETLVFDWARKVGYMLVTRKNFEQTGAWNEHTEGFVDIPRSIRGVEISILFIELSEHQFKVSFRSKGKVNVERVASTFGGGGHINAAACYMDGDFKSVLCRVLKIIEKLSMNP